MGFYIEHRLGVSAPPAVVWRILSDLERWGEWSGLYTNVRGKLRIDEVLTLDLALEGERPETLKASVLDWAPELQIHWKVRLAGGLLTSTRYLEIERLTEEGCIFSNGEVFKGPLARFVPRRLKAKIRRAFAAMSEALKERAETAWRAEAGGPISSP